MESRTFLSTFRKEVAVPEVEGEAKPSLGNWMPLHEADCIIKERFENCMKGRTMYLVPYVMGPIGSHMSRPGVELTDSAYVALSMGIMTRMGERAVGAMKCSEGTSSRLVKGLHCSGRPKDGKLAVPFWPCDPERTVIVHKIEQDEIFSYGSGYGGNSLLAKKCHALRLGSYQAKCEGWLAEHMLIMGVEPECGCGRKHYLTAAFPSACGKTNLAMMKPAVAGYKVSTVGDDIAWIHFNRTTGKLHAINPEYGMFGVAPGTSWKTNPNAMATFMKNAMFTNVALTDDGGVWWEGMEEPCKGVKVTDWHGKPWDKLNAKTPAAHGNSRFTCPIYQCPSLDKDWENCDGVPVSGIIFGGRRPHGMPLVYEALSWNHGVLVGSFVKSEATAAAEHKGGTMMHDPFAMRPFYGYNAGHYLQHWLDIGCTPGLKQPKIFHVNWFLRNKEGGFAWPGYGENIRVLEWMLRRIEGDDTVAEETPIGYVPKEGAINMEGLDPKPDHDHLFKFDKEFWLKEVGVLVPGQETTDPTYYAMFQTVLSLLSRWKNPRNS
ncbi:hypothetical protein AAG570_007314 [Ranatra chinensis]|uniref:phosphoenolpyruvate carboxykinase (GTP) n=1 Tax=Ranatra chinensis TaxID=642074 RepID=A0ABD0XVT9_9HEMI